MTDDLQEHKGGYRRWQGYAIALLVASTVLFAGTAIALPKGSKAASILSIVFGLATILLTVCWFAFETKTQIKGRPAYLFLASLAFGCEVVSLFVALLYAYSSWNASLL